MTRLLLLFLVLTCPLAAEFPQLGEAPTARAPKDQASPARMLADQLPDDGAAAQQDLPSVDVGSRASVRAFYQTQYLPDVAIGWTGNMQTGVPGDTSAEFKQRVVQRINFYRALVGLPTNVTLNLDYSRRAQAAALIMSANTALSHTPPADWKFYTAEGAEAAGQSNLALGLNGAESIDAYIEDYGPNNAAVGHRRWILHPKLVQTGTGDVPMIDNPRTWPANALLVGDGINYGATRTARDGFVAWPYPGYIPHRLVPARYSVTLPNADFANSIVTATHDGTTLEAQVEHRNGNYGEGSAIVFSLAKSGRTLGAGGFLPADLEKPIRISISNTRVGTAVRDITYEVIPFDVTVAGSGGPALNLPGSLPASVGQAFSYQVAAPGATSFAASGLPPGLTINTATGLITGTPTSSGGFTVTITASNGAPTSGTFVINVAAVSNGSARLVNLSTRSRIGTGSESMIAGFVIQGAGSKTVLIRGIGPALQAFGVSGVAQEVILRVNNGSQDIAFNQGWSTNANATQIATASSASGAFALTPGSGDSALLLALPPGNYTAVLTTPAGKEGVGLVEAYETTESGGRLINLSTRGTAGSESATMIAGFVVSGSTGRKLLIRAIGPGLQAFGVGGTLADPEISVQSGTTVVATNDNWGGSSAVSAAAAASGAFALAPTSTDASLLVNLSPGPYTVAVTAKGGSPGVALIEVYETP